MKGILFLVAVFLAWPTMGISLLIFFGWFAVNAYVIEDIKRQKRQREAALRRLAAGEGHPPTWANNADHIEAFMDTTVDMAVRKGVPRSFLKSLTPAQKNAFVNYMGLLEDEGANNRHQGVAAGMFIDALWAEAQRAKPARRTEESSQVLQPGVGAFRDMTTSKISVIEYAGGESFVVMHNGKKVVVALDFDLPAAMAGHAPDKPKIREFLTSRADQHVSMHPIYECSNEDRDLILAACDEAVTRHLSSLSDEP